MGHERMGRFSGVALLAAVCGVPAFAQDPVYDPAKSIARNWNEALLAAIRSDFARPTVHARNLFHTSLAMYDLWAVFDDTAHSFLLGHGVGGYACPFYAEDQARFRSVEDRAGARAAAISYAMYRILSQRFAESPGQPQPRFDALMAALGYDTAFTSTDVAAGDPAALGNYMARCVIDFGLQDGANESGGYLNQSYQPANAPLNPAESGTPGMADPNRWQPLQLAIFIDQAGNQTSTPPFLGAEWGRVVPFALGADDLTLYERDGVEYRVYHDPGAPPLLVGPASTPEYYQWAHALVARWSGHLDPADGLSCDISPASIGNTDALPATLPEMVAFYESLGDGCSVTDRGHAVNPYTGQPYAPQIVPRGDYTRVLAEFWADGPASETPPGHWFAVLNDAVSDHPAFERRYRGSGPVLDPLEWDVKAYFALGGAVHDAAISAWGIKGWYDYVRPISAIRYMASLGQSSEPQAPDYNVYGLPLIDGEVERVSADDPLAGASGEHVGKLKLKAWRGPDYVSNPQTDTAGVGWILADDWWPYQRPTFVTPPFAGYVSGHSTFSRAAAEVLTRLTGDAYFPGGLGEFKATAREYLVFEDGPSVDVTLQWATYRDAADQTSLSRIWGGIHPPVDDIPGRRIGIEVGVDAFNAADRYFSGEAEPLAPAPQRSGGGALTLLTVLWAAAALALRGMRTASHCAGDAAC